MFGCPNFNSIILQFTGLYRKFPKYSDTQNIYCNHSKIWTMWLYHRVISPNDADKMANSIDPDQAALLGAVWSGSTLFAQAYLSENLWSLWYFRHSVTFTEWYNCVTWCCFDDLEVILPTILKLKYLHLPLTFLRWTILDQLALSTDEGQLIARCCR